MELTRSNQLDQIKSDQKWQKLEGFECSNDKNDHFGIFGGQKIRLIL